MAWGQQTMAPLRNGLSGAGRYFNSSRPISSLNGVFRLRYVGVARMAHDDFPSLLCCRSNLRRICHGADVNAAGAIPLQAPRRFYLGSHRRDVQAAPADRFDRWVRVLYGIFCGFLWSESFRALCLPEPIFWSLLVGILDNVCL